MIVRVLTLCPGEKWALETSGCWLGAMSLAASEEALRPRVLFDQIVVRDLTHSAPEALTERGVAMEKSWLWIEGVPGSPKNNGWLELISVSLYRHFQGGGSSGSGSSRGSLSPEPFFTIHYDNAAPVIMSKMVRGDTIEEIILSIGPQTEYHFYNSLITSAQTMGKANGRTPPLYFGINYEKMEVKYSGSP